MLFASLLCRAHRPHRPSGGSGNRCFTQTTERFPLARLPRTKDVVHISDLRSEQSYIEGGYPVVALIELAGARTYLAVPMLKEDELVGAIIIYRQEVRPFTEKQIELVTELRRSGRHRHREHPSAQ